VIDITDFSSSEDDDSVMKKQKQPDNRKSHLLATNKIRTIVMHDLELFDNIFNQLDELKQWCEDIENRLWWIEEAVRLLNSNTRMKGPSWYESLLNKKVNA
jgi:hypothetical protein